MGLETVEIVMGLEQSFGIRIEDKQAEVLLTPGMVIDFISTKLPFSANSIMPWFALRAFHSVRRAFAAAGIGRREVRPGATLGELLRDKDRHARQKVLSGCGLSIPIVLGRTLSSRTVRELAYRMIIETAHDLKPPGEPWTRAEIRSVVRAVITDVSGKEGFKDDDHFIHDIGLG